MTTAIHIKNPYNSSPKKPSTKDTWTIIRIQVFKPKSDDKTHIIINTLNWKGNPKTYDTKTHTYSINPYHNQQPKSRDMTSQLHDVQERMTNTLYIA